MSVAVGNKAPLGRVRRDTFVSALLLSVLTTAGLFYVNIMAALVDALVSGLHFTEAQAGLVSSLNVYGAAVGALISAVFFAGERWRRFSVGLLLIMICIDAVSAFQTAPMPLMALRFLHGLFAGQLVGVGFALIARTASPEGTFGVLLFFEYGFAGVLLWVLPPLIREVGSILVFAALAGFSVLTLVTIPFIPEHPPRAAATPAAAAKLPARASLVPLVVTFSSIFLFQASNMGVAAFGIPLGLHYGLAIGPVSAALGASGWVSMFGCLLVVWVATRFGRLLPIAAGMIVLLLSTWAFHFSASLTVYFIACCVSGAAWGFTIPYLLGMCAAFDPTGRMATLSGFFSKMGLASGPLAAGLLLGRQDYDLMIDVSLVALAVSFIGSLFPARVLDRRAAKA